MKEINFQRYNSASAVKHYASYSEDLQPPEKTILNELRSALGEMDVLDVGVGGGRTTPFLASRARSYIAIDFSGGMLEACKEKWQKEFPDARFEVCNVCDLSRFEPGSFDLVIFSFNGLDNVDHTSRASALEQMRLVLKPGGYLCFSSHNLLYLPKFFSFHFRLHPIKFLRGLIGRKRLLKNNREQLQNIQSADHLIIYDDVYDFGLHTYYIRPGVQKQILLANGFKEVRIFELSKGAELPKEQEISDCNSPWLYYLATKHA